MGYRELISSRLYVRLKGHTALGYIFPWSVNSSREKKT